MRQDVHHGYLPVPWGELHYAACGTGDPIVLVHQTPRSSDEFRDVLPILGSAFWAQRPTLSASDPRLSPGPPRTP